MSWDTHQANLYSQMSWKGALDIIDARIGLHLETEDGPLRHWRRIIGKAYADFQANFLGFDHNSFASFVVSTDGRSEDSDFPNLLLVSERERYGF